MFCRDKEFARLAGGVVYADHAGAALHSDSQALAVASLLNSRLCSNPHSFSSSSSSPSSSFSSSDLRNVARRVLALFGASEDEYSLVWTAGATAALKLVGENFDWLRFPSFSHHLLCHNSALGIRELAKAQNAAVNVISDNNDSDRPLPPGLVCLPGECNFSGVKIDVAKIRRDRVLDEKNVFVLVDGAALAATSAVNVKKLGCDFFCVSFYKMFGLPSGLGALIVKTARAEACFAPKRYFGGGTVEASSASDPNFVVFRRQFADRYQDGTIPFLSILSLPIGMETVARLNPEGEERIFRLAAFVANALICVKHWNGQPAFAVYGTWNDGYPITSDKQGPIVSFNVVGADGHFVGYTKVETLASLEKIFLRTGCFCNPGACEAYLGLTRERVAENVSLGKVCWDDKDVLNNMPTGAVRVSFGWSSIQEDADKIVRFLLETFVEKAKMPSVSLASNGSVVVQQIMLYPIKSCAGMSVQSWPLGERGLEWDREFVVLEVETLNVMTQKRFPRLCLVHPEVRTSEKRMTLSSPCDVETLSIDLHAIHPSTQNVATVAVCGSDGAGRVRVVEDPAITAWLSRVVGHPCLLGQLSPEQDRKVGFANDAQLLVLSQESLDFLNSQYELNVDVRRFRPNLVIAGGHGPHFEDDFQEMTIGAEKHRLYHVRACSRCEMVCIDQASGQIGNQPLRAISSYRRRNGRIEFGSLFECKQPNGKMIHVGDSVE